MEVVQRWLMLLIRVCGSLARLSRGTIIDGALQIRQDSRH
jgi:hypothetical protein